MSSVSMIVLLRGQRDMTMTFDGFESLFIDARLLSAMYYVERFAYWLFLGG